MPWRKLHLAVVGFIILFSILNMAGWHTGIGFLVRIRPEWTLEYPNASLLFILCGVSLAGWILARHRAGLAAAIAAFLFSAAVAAQFAMDVDFGIDGLFLPAHAAFPPPFPSPFPGRIGISSVLCFLSVSTALGLMNHRRFGKSPYPAGLLGSIVSALGGMALLGYLFNVDAAFAWGDFSRMGFFSSMAFCLLGLSISVGAWQSLPRPAGESAIRFLPVCFAVGTAAAALIFWRALVTREREQLEKILVFEMKILENELRRELGGRLQILERHGRLWEKEGALAFRSWERDAKSNFDYFRGCRALAWADSSLVLRWAYPGPENPHWIGWDAGSNAATRSASREAAGAGRLRVSRSLELPGEGPGFMVFQPVGGNGGIDGALVGICGFGRLLGAAISASVRDEFEVALLDGAAMVFPGADPFLPGMEGWIRSGHVDFPGTSWEIRIQPRPLLLNRQLSNLPHMVMAGGLFIALSAAAAMYFGGRARQHASRLQQINMEMSRSAASFVSIVERNADGIAVADGSGTIRFANPAAGSLMGGSPGELVSTHFPFPLEPGSTLELVRKPENGVAQVLELAVMETDWDGAAASLATLRDITERARTREALRRSEARFRHLVDSNFTGVAFMDEEQVVREANESFLRLMGYSREDLAEGKVSWEVLLPAEYREIHAMAVREVRETGKSAPHEKQCLRKDGRTVWVLGALASLGRGEGTVALLMDISDRKAAEEALRRNEEQLRQAQKMEAVGRLAGGVAHDFNNLLTAINGYSDILLSGMEASDPRRPALEEILKAGEKAAGLTRQLLTFSRKQVVVPKVLSANALVTSLAEPVRSLLGENTGLQIDLDPEAGSFTADAALFRQAILTLAANSREAMQEGGRLTISTAPATLSESGQVRKNGVGFHLKAPAGEYVAVTVEDTGSGMEEGMLTHLFEPFFSGKGKGKGNGTGLGLSNVYGIVKVFAGAIRVDSGKGRGTSISLYLPRVSAAVPAGPPPGGTDRAESGPPHRHAGEAILLADDEESVRKMARSILEEKGYAVTAAENGQAALEIFKRHPDAYALLITDIIMPGMGGCELADRIREIRPELRMVFISGYADDERVQKDVLASGAAFLAKPFSPASLLEMVRRTLDAESGAPQVRT